jgi:hypothetical protein
MHRSRHLTLIKTMLAAILVYTAISFHLPLVPEGDVQDLHDFRVDWHRSHAWREIFGGLEESAAFPTSWWIMRDGFQITGSRSFAMAVAQ